MSYFFDVRTQFFDFYTRNLIAFCLFDVNVFDLFEQCEENNNETNVLFTR